MSNPGHRVHIKCGLIRSYKRNPVLQTGRDSGQFEGLAFPLNHVSHGISQAGMRVSALPET